MGLRKPDKGKKSDGLAILLRQDATPSTLANTKADDLDTALKYVLDVEGASAQLCYGGEICFPAIQDVLDKQVAHIFADNGAIEQNRECVGRLGPRPVAVDRHSIFGRLALSPDNLHLESQGNFSSCRANNCVFAGKWMYEATLGTAGIQQIGWATLSCKFTNEEGVGDAEDSYAFDGKRLRKWCVVSEEYGQPWAPGDVIGCCIDLDSGELGFHRNGVSMGVAYDNLRTMNRKLGYFPAVSLSHGERCELNFGNKPFQYPVEGFRPIQPPPPQSEGKLADYLFGCFHRLIEITGSQSALTLSTNLMLSRPKLSADDRVLVAALIVSPLRALLRSPFHVVNSLIPFFKQVTGRPDTNVTVANLMMAVDLLEATLGRADFQRTMMIVINTLSRSCGASPFLPKDLPNTASYPHISLMTALLKSDTVRALFVKMPNLNFLLEGFLTRKQPTAEDLKELLPSVWWRGCKDENASEQRMGSVVASLSTALQKVEQAQFELLKQLLEEDKKKGYNNYVLNFFKHLLKINQGASRNVQPPGLSDTSVLVSSFNLLLRLLRPSLMLQPDSHSCLEDFPAIELFVDGYFTLERNLHGELPRLGGLLSYLRKEHPLMIAARIPVHVNLDEDVGIVAGGPECSAQHHIVPHSMVANLLHVLVLLYKLGIEGALKMTLHQFQSESSLRSSLCRSEQRLANLDKSSTREKKKMMMDVQKQRENMVKAVRHCTWYKVVLFTPWKQECMFLLTVYLSKMLSSLSEYSEDLFRYVPEVYIEAMLDLFQAVAKAEPRFADIDHLELLGLQHVIGFLVRHFNHPMLVNPQICDAVLQAMAALFADKEFLAACETNSDAQRTLMPDLLKAFDTRYWLSISNIFLSMAKGTGFGQSHLSGSGGSTVFRKLLVNTCNEQPNLLDGFLNRLFNTLNWTVTEMTVTLGEVEENVERGLAGRGNYSNSELVRQYRKASVLFNLSINLLRLLELVAWQMPYAFLKGSKLNMARVVEVLGFVLSHVTTGSDSRVFDRVLNAPQSLPEWKSKVSRPAILAPLAGILVVLHKACKSSEGKKRGRSGGSVEEFDHSIVGALAESLSCPSECLHYLGTVDWKSTTGISSKALAPLQEVLKAHTEELKKRNQREACTSEPESIPEEFLDPIVMTLMEDPVTLPDSKITVDRSTIERHLLTQQTDPFSRADLTKDMLEPNHDLKRQIDEWLSEQKRLKS